MSVTEAELRELLRRHHWTLNAAKTGKQKAYSAKQRRGKHTESRYIGTTSKLRDMSEADVLKKLDQTEESPENTENA